MFVFASGVLAMQAGYSLAATASRDVPLPPAKPVQPPVERSRHVQPPAAEATFSNVDENGPDDGSKCKTALSAAGATYDWVGTATEGACSIGNAVKLLTVDNSTDMITFRQKPVMACDFAALMARWAGEVAGPVIAGHTGAQLKSIATGPGIVCRRRVGGAQTRISEHAKGNALGNGIDEDHNGYVDDIVGRNFVRNRNKPWNYDGHGMFVTGVIAAAQPNGTGIPGISSSGMIMLWKALDALGRGYASMATEAINYAAEHDARIINLSLCGRTLTKVEQLAVDHAQSKGAIVVVGAGNSGQSVADFSPAAMSAATAENAAVVVSVANTSRTIDISR